jgi:hypothetical protein
MTVGKCQLRALFVFLTNYKASLLQIQQKHHLGDDKGKQTVGTSKEGRVSFARIFTYSWKPPQPGKVKIDTKLDQTSNCIDNSNGCFIVLQLCNLY